MSVWDQIDRMKRQHQDDLAMAEAELKAMGGVSRKSTTPGSGNRASRRPQACAVAR